MELQNFATSVNRVGIGITPLSEPAPRKQPLFQNMLFLEIFAGTSSLTIAVRKTDLRGVAIDKTTERAKGPITILDLTLDEDIVFLDFGAVYFSGGTKSLPYTLRSAVRDVLSCQEKEAPAGHIGTT